MRFLITTFLFAAGLGQAGCSPCQYGTAPDGTHHYFDCEQKPLPQWDFVWDQLYAYFGSATPQTITLEHWDGDTSRFNPGTMSIKLGSGHDRVETVAHESAHLCNYNLTQGASTTNQFRFIDEGFAEIMEFAIASQADWYRTFALAVAEQERQRGRVSFEQVQDWSTYFGDSSSAASSRNWNAYQVGSSFELMLEDTRGAEALRAFFVDIGNTRDLGATVARQFSSTTGAVEQEWLEYLGRVKLDPSTPTITAMSPPDGATDVPLATAEITVTFSVPMGQPFCITAPCGDTGLCTAYWKARNVLAIKVDGSLKSGTAYTIGLGREGCALKSYVGAALPAREWRFTTADG